MGTGSSVILSTYSNRGELQAVVCGGKVGVLNPGVDVMIKIFCDFCQFSGKKIGVFLKKTML
jgi:hypothetical protein